MNHLAVSTILPTHNRADLLRRSIISVLNQLSQNDELIVVDDGSTDNTEDVASEFKGRLKYLKTSCRGAGAARNTGIRHARNPLIAFIDSDDEWLPGKIEIQRAFMSAMPEVLFCFSNFSFRETKALGGYYKPFHLTSWTNDHRSWNEILGIGQKISSKIKLPEGVDDFQFHVGSMCKLELCVNYISIITLTARRSEASGALHFAEDVPTYEDWECIGRLACAGKAAYLDVETACQHSHGGPRLTDSHITECAQARVKILPRVWGSNEEFLQEHNGLYQNVLNRERLTLIDGLLVRGETAKARLELKQITGKAPFSRSLLAALPGRITKMLLAFRRAMNY